MLVSHVSSGERLAAPTCVCAPRWNTVRTSCATSAQPIRPCAPVTRTVSGCRPRRDSVAAGHGREDRDLVAVLDLGVEPVEEADVLATHVHVHEAAQIPILGDPVAEAVVALVQAVED